MAQTASPAGSTPVLVGGTTIVTPNRDDGFTTQPSSRNFAHFVIVREFRTCSHRERTRILRQLESSLIAQIVAGPTAVVEKDSPRG